MQTSRTWLAVLALVFLAGCFSGDDDEALADPKAARTVAAAGGSVVSPDGTLTLTVPAGALSASTEISITEVAPDHRSDLVLAQKADRVYRLEPSWLKFALPVTVRIELPPSGAGEYALALVHSDGVFESPRALALGRSSPR